MLWLFSGPASLYYSPAVTGGAPHDGLFHPGHSFQPQPQGLSAAPPGWFPAAGHGKQPAKPSMFLACDAHLHEIPKPLSFSGLALTKELCVCSSMQHSAIVVNQSWLAVMQSRAFTGPQTTMQPQLVMTLLCSACNERL